jgi:hypothetical protein
MTHDQELSILWCENKQLQPKKKKKKKKKKNKNLTQIKKIK